MIKQKMEETNFQLFQECLVKYTMKEMSNKLNLSVGTLKRWIELKNVPVQYIFEFYKLMSREIDYTKYASSLKDQFFTPSHIVEECWSIFKSKVTLDTADYQFIEPSAGDGSFLRVLPKGTLAFDIEPRAANIQKQDYLTWIPPDTSKKYIVFGNPPFGLRGHIALQFINHSFAFADYVCFILPQLFQSDGKGSPRKRVNGYNLIHSQLLSAMFYTPDGQDVKVNGVFQIWSKHSTNVIYDMQKVPKDVPIKIYSMSDGGTIASTRNKKMIGKCNVYIPSTCFGRENMKPYTSFDDLPGRRGYGIVFLQNKDVLLQKFNAIDWATHSFLSTNSAYNLRTSIIFSTLAK